MSSLKCLNCSLVNFADVTICKRCNASLSAASPETPVRQSITSQDAVTPRSAGQASVAQPAFVSIVKNDYLAFIGIIFPVVFWGLFIAANVFGFSLSRRGSEIKAGDSDSTFLYLAIGGTILGVALLVWRVYSVQQVFANGQEVVGRITSISFLKDRGRIDYSYIVNRQTYQSGNGIMKNQKTRSFSEGDEIRLIVKASNPSCAFIKELYL